MNLGIWVISAQQFSKGILEPHVSRIVDSFCSLLDLKQYCENNKENSENSDSNNNNVNTNHAKKKRQFTSTSIEHEIMNALGKLLNQVPHAMLPLASQWLPLLYSRLLSDTSM